MILFITVWFVSGILGYGLIYSCFKNHFKAITTYRYEFLWTSLFGILTLIFAFIFLISELGIKNMFKYGIEF